ncbi:MAG: M48 family metallopeptidase [Desulfosalsimonas sp.]
MFEKSRRARHFSISVMPFKGVRVAVPLQCSFKAAEQAVKKKTSWIRKRQESARGVEEKQEKILEGCGYISRASARGIIVGRLEELAEKHGISYNKVFIRNQKTRWGSCSSRGNLSLNYRIALLPGELMDYVIIHELVHIRHHNHSPLFWAELDRLAGDAKALDSRLNEYQALLLG